MPAETHRHAFGDSADEIAELLLSLTAEAAFEPDESEDTTLAELGVDAVGLLDLWEAVCEEFVERSLGPEFDPVLFESTMSIRAAADVMTNLLNRQARDP